MIDIISYIDRDRIIRYMSPSVCLLLGYHPEEMVGLPALALVHPGDRKRVLEEADHALNEKAATLKLEYRYRRAAGNYVWLESLCRFIRDEEGKLEGAVFGSRDISARRKAEEDLRRSEAQYRLLAENTSDVVWLVDLASRRVDYVSPSVERLRGFTQEEVKNQPALGVLTPESYRKVAEILPDRLAAFAAGDESMRKQVIEVDQPCKDGRVISTEILTTLITGEDGRVAKIAGSSRDITQRKILEAALKKSRDELEIRVEERTAELKESQARLQSVFDGITDPLVMLDRDLKVIMLNCAAGDYFGKGNTREVIEGNCFEVFRDTDRLCPDGQIEKAVFSGLPVQFERRGLMDPKRWENLMLYPMREEAEGIKGIILRIADITEKKIAENEVIQRQKMEALGILISGIGHEINNPNNFISFNMPILQDYLGALLSLADETAQSRPEASFFGMTYPEFREDVFRLLENVRNGSDRINAIVSQLKAFSRKRGGLELRETDIREVVNQVVDLAGNQLKTTIHSLDVALADNLPPFRTDPDALGQVLLNLLINGAQAADKPDSWIRMTVEQRPVFPKWLIIEVADNGCGIDAEILGRIFDPFFTTKKAGKGTGLGLYVCQNLVENLGGRIEVQSEPGRGSRFQVFLPV
jgi:PAS domain S-box-containing protein